MGRIEARLYVRGAMEPRRGVATKISISFGEEDIAFEDRIGIPKLLIPKIFLFGTQPDNAYERAKRRRVEEMLRSEGTTVLIKKPATICAVPLKNAIMLAIMDGHHRTRYSPKTNAMVGFVYAPEQIVRLLHKNDPSLNITADELIDDIDRSVTIALNSFKSMPNQKLPHLVTGVNCVDDLRKQFQEL